MRCLKHYHKNTYLNLPQTQVIYIESESPASVTTLDSHASGPLVCITLVPGASAGSSALHKPGHCYTGASAGLQDCSSKQVLSFVPACSATLVLFYITLPLSLYCFKAALTPSVWLIIPSSLPPAPPKNSAKMRVQSFLSVFFLCFPLRSCQVRIALCEQFVRVAML